MKIVLCGPPHSGKSCLKYGLKEAIRGIPGAPYPYVITACPDGEGSWYQETYSAHPELAESLKRSYKGKFTEEQVEKWAKWVVSCSEPLTIVDIGGLPDDKNERICRGATHAVLLSGDAGQFPVWRQFCHTASLQVIAEVYSDYRGNEDRMMQAGEDGVYRGSVHYLERGDVSVQHRPTVVQLASIIVELAAQEK
jgi:CRISPR-associated protein Csx3